MRKRRRARSGATGQKRDRERRQRRRHAEKRADQRHGFRLTDARHREIRDQIECGVATHIHTSGHGRSIWDVVVAGQVVRVVWDHLQLHVVTVLPDRSRFVPRPVELAQRLREQGWLVAGGDPEVASRKLRRDR